MSAAPQPVRLDVALGERSYPILIGSGLIADPACYAPYLSGSQVLIVSNETVAPLYIEAVRGALAGREVQEVILPDGEAYKTLEVWNRIFDALLSHRFGRDCTIAGAVGMAGHLEIGDNVHFTGMAMVTRSFLAPGVYSSGIPAMANADWRRNAARFRHLDDLTRRVKYLEAELAKLIQGVEQDSD